MKKNGKLYSHQIRWLYWQQQQIRQDRSKTICLFFHWRFVQGGHVENYSKTLKCEETRSPHKIVCGRTGMYGLEKCFSNHYDHIRVSEQTCKLQPRRFLMHQKSVIFWKKSLTWQSFKIWCHKVQFSSVKSSIPKKLSILHSWWQTLCRSSLQQTSLVYNIVFNT